MAAECLTANDEEVKVIFETTVKKHFLKSPSPAVSLIQWLPQTHLEYDGMILLKFQEKQGSLDDFFEVSRYQRWGRTSNFLKRPLRSNFRDNNQGSKVKAMNIRIQLVKVSITSLPRPVERMLVETNKQLHKGEGWQTWKCHGPLNCVALVAFRKHGTLVQIWISIFQVHLHKSRKLPAWFWPQAWLPDEQWLLKSAWLVPPYLWYAAQA